MTDAFDNFMKPSYLERNKKNKLFDKLIREWAYNAHLIDKSKPIGFYYKLFDQRLKENYIKRKQAKKVFGENTIEL